MDLRIHGLHPSIIRQAKARAEAAGESLSDVVRRLVTRYAEQGEYGQQRAASNARTQALSPERRREIATRAAAARWNRDSEQD